VSSSPGHMRHGLSRQDGGLRLAVWAPRTERLAVRAGDRAVALTPAPGGWWTTDLPALPAGTPYALVFPDGRVRPDPAAQAQAGDVHGPSAVFDPGAFAWTDRGWTGVPLEALVLYEVHVGTFTETGTLDAAAARLPELVDLGITRSGWASASTWSTTTSVPRGITWANSARTPPPGIARPGATG